MAGTGDGILHVNPQLKTARLAMLYNPLEQAITRDIKLPLYYTGLKETAQAQIEDGAANIYTLDRGYAYLFQFGSCAESYMADSQLNTDDVIHYTIAVGFD